MTLIEKLAEEFAINVEIIEKTAELIDEGNTIPFIARYRKEITGGMTDVTLRALNERLEYLRNLETRKEEVIAAIEEQGKLTDELLADIKSSEILQRVEDLYKPFKKKKSTRASKAKEKGLEPLAVIIQAQEMTTGEPLLEAERFVNEELGVESAKDALEGACDIIAEIISEDVEILEIIREISFNTGELTSEAVDAEESTVYDMYDDYREAIAKIPNHRVLAINRGEKEKKLKVKLNVESEAVIKAVANRVITNETSIWNEAMNSTIADAYKRLISPSIERELRNQLTECAEREAVKVFAKNTERLLMVPPVKKARVLSIDPGYRTGCKVAALDERGKLLAYGTIYPTKPKEDIEGAERTVTKLIDKFDLNIVVIGNGTASRETEKFIADYITKTGRDLKYTIVSEAGASVYSASKLASEEYPDLDVTTRGAMSIGRRLQDPMAELVKITPRSIGVGQYQHDIDKNMLDRALTDVVEDCVNRVGVDLNTASSSLLSYISGINSGIAKNIVKYREENGAFTQRRQLLDVPKLGPKTFEQCAGFLRINDGTEPLDATGVHPESYKATEVLLEKLGVEKSQLRSGGVADIEDRIRDKYPTAKKRTDKSNKKKERRLSDSGLAALAVLMEDENFNPAIKKNKKRKSDKGSLKRSINIMAQDVGIGEMTLSDIVEEIRKPGRDPRNGMPGVVFRRDVLSFDDLKVDMELEGTVRNVVDFGAFVDIGVKQDGLVHISQISDKYIKDPMTVVNVGDTVKVRILEVDKEKQKIALTMKTK